jgi:hypothetical protein
MSILKSSKEFIRLDKESMFSESKEFSSKDFEGLKYYYVVLDGSVSRLKSKPKERFVDYFKRVSADNDRVISKFTKVPNEGALEYTGATYGFDNLEGAKSLASKIAKYMGIDSIPSGDLKRGYSAVMIYGTNSPLVDEEGQIADVLADAFVTTNGLVYQK